MMGRWLKTTAWTKYGLFGVVMGLSVLRKGGKDGFASALDVLESQVAGVRTGF